MGSQLCNILSQSSHERSGPMRKDRGKREGVGGGRVYIPEPLLIIPSKSNHREVSIVRRDRPNAISEEI